MSPKSSVYGRQTFIDVSLCDAIAAALFLRSFQSLAARQSFHSALFVPGVNFKGPRVGVSPQKLSRFRNKKKKKQL